MSKEHSDIYQELITFIEEGDFKNEKEASAAFLQHIQDEIAADQDTQPDAYDYLERAQEGATASLAVKYAKKALELDPSLTEAELILLAYQSMTPQQRQIALERLLKKEEANLKEQGITKETCAGEYYGIHETRSYLQIFLQYIHILIKQGKMRKAAEGCRNVITLNHNDNLGTRYTLMALYALLEEREAAEALYQEYPSETGFMLLPMVALYYKLDDMEKAEECLRRMCGRNKQVKKAIKLLQKAQSDDDEQASAGQDELADILGCPFYAPFSMHELVLAYSENIFLYQTIDPYFSQWVVKHTPTQAGNTAKRKKKK